MNSLKRTRIEELKIKAALLLKGLRSDDLQRRKNAAKRFLVLPFLKHTDTAGVLGDIAFYRLKHALTVIAIEQGSSTWSSLRTKAIMEDCLFHNTTSSFLNIWFNNYEDAKEYHTAHGGYLLLYRKDYVVCQREYIESIKLNHLEREWEVIGYDWARPANKQSWDKLFEVAKQNYLTRKPVAAQIDKTKRPVWVADSLSR